LEGIENKVFEKGGGHVWRRCVGKNRKENNWSETRMEVERVGRKQNEIDGTGVVVRRGRGLHSAIGRNRNGEAKRFGARAVASPCGETLWRCG
jgi:hypothetical protein